MTAAIQTRNIDKSQTGMVDKVRRQLAKFRHRDMLDINLDRPVVSFTFDDCPKSIVETALPMLEKEGWRATIYMACGLCDITNHFGLHMSLDDVKAVSDSGHEIGDHSYSHLDGMYVPVKTFMSNIDRNQETLDEIGVAESRTFAYPYGQVTAPLKKAMLERFELSRGVVPSSAQQIDLGLSPATQIYSGQDMAMSLSRAKALKDAPNWEVFFTHDVRPNPSDYGCTKEDLAKVIRAVKDSGALVLPVAEALDHVRQFA